MNFFKLLWGVIGLLLVGINTLITSLMLTPIAYLKRYTKNIKLKKNCLFIIHKIGSCWITINYYILKLINKIHWEVIGSEEIKKLSEENNNQWYLIIANHQSWNDVFVLQFLFNHILPFQKYFVKEELRKLPMLGLMWEAIDCPFLKRNADKTKSNLDLAEIQVKAKQFRLLPCTVVNFVEGTRFSEKKHEHQHSPYKYLLKPKTGGLAQVLEEFNTDIKYLIDVSIYYDKPAANFFDLFNGQVKTISVKISVITMPSWLQQKYINQEKYLDYKDQFQAWIDSIWLEKDSFLLTKNKVRK